MDVLEKYEELRNKTVPGLLLERAELTPQDVAYRAKKFGIYKECTWQALSSRVTHCAMGLRTLGSETWSTTGPHGGERFA